MHHWLKILIFAVVTSLIPEATENNSITNIVENNNQNNQIEKHKELFKHAIVKFIEQKERREFFSADEYFKLIQQVQDLKNKTNYVSKKEKRIKERYDVLNFQGFFFNFIKF